MRKHIDESKHVWTYQCNKPPFLHPLYFTLPGVTKKRVTKNHIKLQTSTIPSSFQYDRALLCRVLPRISPAVSYYYSYGRKRSLLTKLHSRGMNGRNGSSFCHWQLASAPLVPDPESRGIRWSCLAKIMRIFEDKRLGGSSEWIRRRFGMQEKNSFLSYLMRIASLKLES